MSRIDRDPVWQDKYILNLLGGMRSNVPAESLAEDESPHLNNVILYDGLVQIDTGIKAFHGTIRGVPRKDATLKFKDGTSKLVLITDATVYEDSGTEWKYVSDGTSTTTTAVEPAGETAIAVTSEVGFSATDHIGITLDDGSQHKTTVASTSAGVINIDDPIPAGRNSPNGTTVLKAVALSGDENFAVSITHFIQNDWLVFTNGIDTPKRFNGTDCVDVPGLISAFTTFSARACATFKNHLLFFATTENGVTRLQRVRRSDTADPTNWTTGNAGLTDLLGTDDAIVAGIPLGTYIIVYRERSIERLEYVGSADLLFNFEPTIPEIGAVGHDAVANLGNRHIFLGNTNIYEYAGDFGIQEIGQDVYNEIFGRQGFLDTSLANRAWAIYVEDLSEVWFGLIGNGQNAVTRFIRMDVPTQGYTRRELPTPISGFGASSNVASLTWASMSGTWAEQSIRWNSNQLNSGAPIIHLLARDNLQVYEYDYVTVNDIGNAIPYEVQTKDISIPGYLLRVDHIKLKAKGTNIEVSYSTDEGETWVPISTESPGSFFTTVTIHRQFVGERVRLKFSGSGGGFALQWVRVKYRPESEW